MTSKVQIANVALTLIGGNTISSFSETSTEAVLANIHFDQTRQDLLRKHPWNFSIKRLELARSNAAPEFTYLYKYALPSDWILTREVLNNDDFKIEGRFILTDATTCYLKYVYDNTDTTSWDASFVDLMSYALAQKMAYALTKSTAKETDMYNILQQKLQTAKFNDSTEDIEDDLGFQSALIQVRG